MKGTAAIVGAGIAGLAAARSLTEGGWDVQVLERSSTLSTSGTLIGVWPTAYTALERLGVADRLQSIDITSGTLLRPDGRVLASLTLPQKSHAVSRISINEGLYAGLPEGTVRFGAAVRSPADLPQADVVIAADGVHSSVRAAAFPDARLRDGGTVAFRGVAPVASTGPTETWGRNLIFGRAPFPGGGSNWYAGVRADLAGTRDDDPLAVLQALYRDWHPAVHEVLDSLTPQDIDRRRIEDLAPLKSYVSGNIVLVGDAAHAMSPHLGRGGCESLVDGLALGEALLAAPSVAEGLARYDAERRRPSQKSVLGSRIMARLTNLQSHPWARDTLVAAVGALLARRRPAPSSAGSPGRAAP
ncbi:FAD-dependent oxidoreductase [Sinomonas flava]|uniref:FAD-dependent monooxygenase n=1 Tax=Sinomonas flava TaxID=496857 RepID=A0ABP5NKE7_9MICC